MDFDIQNIVANHERYQGFTILDTPTPFKELYKDKDINLVQVHTATPAGDNDIVGFCGVFEWKDNTLISLDGDSYDENMLVLAYSVFQTPETASGQAMDILVGEDW